MNRHRWWHRLRGHRITLIVPDFEDPAAMASLEYTKVRDRCSCGDEWVFFGLMMQEFYYPAGSL
jgi:hypothetical protein